MKGTATKHESNNHTGESRDQERELEPSELHSFIMGAWPYLILIVVCILSIVAQSFGLFERGLGLYLYVGACAVLGLLGVVGLISWGTSEIAKNREALRLSSLVATGDGLHTEIESKSPCFSLHWKAVSYWADSIAKEMDLTEMDVRTIRRAAEIMDIGMMDLLDEIGTSPADERARKLIREHPVMSEDILGMIRPDWDVLPLVRHHHERFDGSGYPDCLKGEDIPMGSRVLAAADSLVAMASERSYRERRGSEDIVAELHRHSGSQFDPRCVEALMRIGDRISGAFEDPKKVLFLNHGRPGPFFN